MIAFEHVGQNFLVLLLGLFTFELLVEQDFVAEEARSLEAGVEAEL